MRSAGVRHGHQRIQGREEADTVDARVCPSLLGGSGGLSKWVHNGDN